MKIAVTGASGFIGKYVVKELAKIPSIEIIALTGPSSKTNIFSGGNIKEIQIDLNCIEYESIYRNIGRPEALIHLAWQGLPNYLSQDHTDIYLPSQYRFIKAIVDSGLKSLVVTGTCFEYGLSEGELSEDSPLIPITAYGEAKKKLYESILELKKSHNFNFNWLRLFYLHGEGQSKTSIYSQFKDACKNKVNFDMSLGEQWRDYMHVQLASSYIAKIAMMNNDCGAINICTGKPVSIRELVESWRDAEKSNIQLNLGVYPYPKYEAFRFWGSDKKLQYWLNNFTMHQ